ncbi:flagellar protein FliT [Endozoicomonadaceae bacterium StTr2]
MTELQQQSAQFAQQQQMLSKCLMALRQAHKNSRWDVLPGIDDRVNQCLNQLKAHVVNDQFPASIQPLINQLVTEYRSVIDDCNREREQLKQKLGNIRHAQHAMEAYKDGMLAGGRR